MLLLVWKLVYKICFLLALAFSCLFLRNVTGGYQWEWMAFLVIQEWIEVKTMPLNGSVHVNYLFFLEVVQHNCSQLYLADQQFILKKSPALLQEMINVICQLIIMARSREGKKRNCVIKPSKYVSSLWYFIKSLVLVGNLTCDI